MTLHLTPDYADLETYRGFTIQGRLLDLEAKTQWEIQLRIGLDEPEGFVEKLPRIDRTTFKGDGALNLGMGALAEARAAIDDFIEH
jgi:hypothetical protein